MAIPFFCFRFFVHFVKDVLHNCYFVMCASYLSQTKRYIYALFLAYVRLESHLIIQEYVMFESILFQ